MPFFARAKMFLPVRAMGMPTSWIGDGVSQPFSKIPIRSSRFRQKSSKLVPFVSVTSCKEPTRELIMNYKKTKQSFNRHQSKDATQLTLVFFLLSLGGIFSCDFQKLSVLFSLSPVETRKHVIALTRYNQKARFLMRLTSWKGPAHLASWATSRGCWLSSPAD